jgi:hypothetical protein
VGHGHAQQPTLNIIKINTVPRDDELGRNHQMQEEEEPHPHGHNMDDECEQGQDDDDGAANNNHLTSFSRRRTSKAAFAMAARNRNCNDWLTTEVVSRPVFSEKSKKKGPFVSLNDGTF